MAASSILALLRTVRSNSVELWRKPCIFWYFLEMRYSLFSKDDFTGFLGCLTQVICTQLPLEETGQISTWGHGHAAKTSHKRGSDSRQPSKS